MREIRQITLEALIFFRGTNYFDGNWIEFAKNFFANRDIFLFSARWPVISGVSDILY